MKQPVKSALVASSGVLAIVGLVLAPAVANAVTGTTTVNAVVGSTISIATSGTVNLAITPTAGGSATSASDSVVVTTNRSTGYNLKINAGAATLSSGGNSIAAAPGTIAAPVALGTNTWGFRFDDASAGTGFTAAPATTAETNVAALTNTKWAAVPTTAATIKTTSAAATSGDTTAIFYGAKVDTTKPDGTYTGTVTYTAVVN
jgi:hypothetical protein